MVTFYTINAITGAPEKPVLFLDTLKVSTIEQTASQVDARGGKGNPKLITWDYGKEITVNITDALFSPKSMSILYGDGKPTSSTGTIQRIAMIKATEDSQLPNYFIGDVNRDGGAERLKIMMAGSALYGDQISWASAQAGGLTVLGVFKENGEELKTNSQSIGSSNWATANAAITAGDRFFVKYQLNAKQSEIVISGDTFPGTYYVTGDTYARSDVTGKDEFFQFVIPKAKMSSQNTITLEAEGDPTTFNMNLTVLRPENGEMMKLIQYQLTNG